MFLLLCFPLTVSFSWLVSFGGIPAITFVLGWIMLSMLFDCL